jgi:hypothetical protein
VGDGVEGEPCPSERGEDKQSVPNKGRAQHGRGRRGPLKSDVMKEDQREQSRQSRIKLNSVNLSIKISILIIVPFFQENKSYGGKPICIDPLSTRC